MYHTGSEHYAISNTVLPILDLHSAVDLRIDMETRVKPSLGLRRYEWLRGCPDGYSASTRFYIAREGPQREDL